MKLSLSDAKRDLGLQVTDLKVGSGEVLKAGDTATMGYVGKLDNGKIFDQGQYTFTFGEGQVIQGDDLGLQGMRVGGKRRLVIPPSLGYGKAGYPGSIPPHATLHFDVQLYSECLCVCVREREMEYVSVCVCARPRTL
jgi:FKBP-type peptidyl-prolyl cis-trans isomerase